MRKAAAVIGTVALSGLVAVGCGSSGGSATADAGSSSTTSSVLTQADLQAQLLTPAELGAGWTADESSSSSGPPPSCLQGIVNAKSPTADETNAEASFAQGQTVFAYEGLGGQVSEEVAQDSLAKVTTALDGCSDLTFTAQGEVIPGTITPTGGVNLGTGGKGYSMAFSVQGVPLGIDIIVTSVGSTDVIVMYGTLGDPQPGAVTSMAELAIKKIQDGSAA